MNFEKTKKTPDIRLTQRGKRVRNALVATVAVAGVGAGVAANNHNATHFDGTNRVKLTNGDTVSDIAKYDVEGGASHVGDVVNEIVRRNPDVFQDGSAYVGSEDLGETIEVPGSSK